MDVDLGRYYIKKNSQKNNKPYNVKSGINHESEEKRFNHSKYSRGIRLGRKRPEKPCVGSSILLLGTIQYQTLHNLWGFFMESFD